MWGIYDWKLIEKYGNAKIGDFISATVSRLDILWMKGWNFDNRGRC